MVGEQTYKSRDMVGSESGLGCLLVNIYKFYTSVDKDKYCIYFLLDEINFGAEENALSYRNLETISKYLKSHFCSYTFFSWAYCFILRFFDVDVVFYVMFWN